MLHLKVDIMIPMPRSISNIPRNRPATLLSKVTRTRTPSSKLATAHQLKAASSTARPRLRYHITILMLRVNVIINNTLLHHQRINSRSRDPIPTIKLPTILTTPAHTAKLLQPAATVPRTLMRKQKATVV
jgi:hypothetical protein